jgi:GNAT superfamily N-acetyltransferase
MQISIRQASTPDTQKVSAILLEAAEWLKSSGKPMWRGHELSEEKISSDVCDGLFFISEVSGEPAGTIKFQLEDPLFWPECPPGESAYVHRLAVRRRFSGGTVSNTLLDWAVERTRGLNRPYLRLDCESSRLRLRAVYEKFGFKHHSNRQVGPYFVSRYQFLVRKAG